MKMNGQSRTFVKQVKLDLLALCDSDLSQIIQQWVERSNLTAKSPDKAEETWLALGYTRTLHSELSLWTLKCLKQKLKSPRHGMLLNQNIFEHF